MTLKVDRSWVLDLGGMVLLLSILYLTLLGHRPLFVPDEGRYAEIAREMLARHDYITPYLNGIKYFEKPPLFYWLESGSMTWLGINITAVRLVNGLISILGCLATYVTARLVYDRRTGLVSAGILASAGLYFIMGHTVSLDLPVTVFFSCTLYAIMLAITTSHPITKRRYVCAAAFFAALAVLTKGLIGLALPGMIVLCFIALTRDSQLLRACLSSQAIGLFLLVALPWHIAVSIQNPEFPYFYFIEQQFLRYSKVGIGHYQPMWFFIPWLIIGFFPWVIFLGNAVLYHAKEIAENRAAKKISLLLSITIVIVFVFFSISKSKLIPYILPLFPILSIFTARYLASISKEQCCATAKIPCYLLTVFAVIITAASAIYLSKTTLPDTHFASMSMSIGCAALWLAVFALWRAQQSFTMRAMSILFVCSAIFWFSIYVATPALDTRSILPLATPLKTILQAQDEVISYNRYYQDLPFYLQRRVSIVNWRNELSFGMEHQANIDWMLTEQAFMSKINAGNPHGRIFILMRKEDWQRLQGLLQEKKYKAMGATINDVLIGSR